MPRNSQPTPSVLVVDDDATTRAIVSAAVENQGMIAIGCASAEEAIDVMRATHVSVAVVDLMMPRMDGFGLCHWIRRNARTARLPVLVLTSLDDDDAIRRALDAGATDFTAKPVNLLVLGHRIRFLLRNCEIGAELARSEERLAHAQRIARVGHFEWFCDRDRVSIAPGLARLLAPADAVTIRTSADFFALVHPDDRERVAASWKRAAVARVPLRLTHRVVRGDGHILEVECQGVRLEGEEFDESCLLATLQDVTERRASQSRIAYLVGHDRVTGLPSREVFRDRATELLGTEHGHRAAELLCLHVDNFSILNEVHGTATADAVLTIVSERTEQFVRAEWADDTTNPP